MSKVQTGGAAIVCAIICPSKGIGLFIQQPDMPDPMWKMASGEVENGESIPAALFRETKEETGFEIPTEKASDGSLIVGNDDFFVVPFGMEKTRGRKGWHDKYFFAVVVADPRKIIELDGQIRKEDDEETVITKVFELAAIAVRQDFLPHQRPFLGKVLKLANDWMQ